MAWRRRLDPRNVERLVTHALAALAEFGEPSADVAAMTEGPLTDPAARRQFVTEPACGVRARRLSSPSPFDARRFDPAGVRVERLDPDALLAVPVTVKQT